MDPASPALVVSTADTLVGSWPFSSVKRLFISTVQARACGSLAGLMPRADNKLGGRMRDKISVGSNVSSLICFVCLDLHMIVRVKLAHEFVNLCTRLDRLPPTFTQNRYPCNPCMSDTDQHSAAPLTTCTAGFDSRSIGAGRGGGAALGGGGGRWGR